MVLHYLLEKQNRNNLACLKPQHTYKTYKKWAKGIPHPSISPTSKPGIVSPCHRWPYEPSIYNNADVVDHLMVVLVMLFCGLQRLLNDPQHISDRLMMHLPYWKRLIVGVNRDCRELGYGKNTHNHVYIYDLQGVLALRDFCVLANLRKTNLAY